MHDNNSASKSEQSSDSSVSLPGQLQVEQNRERAGELDLVLEGDVARRCFWTGDANRGDIEVAEVLKVFLSEAAGGDTAIRAISETLVFLLRRGSGTNTGAWGLVLACNRRRESTYKRTMAVCQASACAGQCRGSVTVPAGTSL